MFKNVENILFQLISVKDANCDGILILENETKSLNSEEIESRFEYQQQHLKRSSSSSFSSSSSSSSTGAVIIFPQFSVLPKISSATISGGGKINSSHNATLKINFVGRPPLFYRIRRQFQNSSFVDTEQLESNLSQVWMNVNEEGTYSVIELIDGNKRHGETSGTAQVSILCKDIRLNAFLVAERSSICPNGQDKLNLQVFLFGEKPWTFTIDFQAQKWKTFESVFESPFSVLVSQNGTYTLSNVIDSDSCQRFINQSVDITNSILPEASISATKTKACRNEEVNVDVSVVVADKELAPFVVIFSNGSRTFREEIYHVGLPSKPVPVLPGTTYRLLSISDRSGCSNFYNQPLKSLSASSSSDNNNDNNNNNKTWITVEQLALPTCTQIGAKCASLPPQIQLNGQPPFELVYMAPHSSQILHLYSKNESVVRLIPPSNDNSTKNETKYSGLWRLRELHDATGCPSLCKETIEVSEPAQASFLITSEPNNTIRVCPNQSARVRVLLTGMPPFRLSVSLNDSLFKVFNNIEQSEFDGLLLSKQGTYKLMSIKDGNDCEGSVDNTIRPPNVNPNYFIDFDQHKEVINDVDNKDKHWNGLVLEHLQQPFVSTFESISSVPERNWICAGEQLKIHVVGKSPWNITILLNTDDENKQSQQTKTITTPPPSDSTLISSSSTSFSTSSSSSSSSLIIHESPFIFSTPISKYNATLEIAKVTDGNNCESSTSYSIPIHAIPTAKIFGGGTICETNENQQKQRLFFELTGTPPWTIEYSDGQNTWIETNILQSNFVTFQSESGKFRLTKVQDRYCQYP